MNVRASYDFEQVAHVIADSGSHSMPASPSMLTEIDIASALDISAVTMDVARAHPQCMDMSATQEAIAALAEGGFASRYMQTARMTDTLDLAYDANIFGPIAGNAMLEGVP